MRKSVCLNHPERETTLRCTACLRPICDECVVPTPEGRFCSLECHANAIKTGQRLEELKRKEAEAERARRAARMQALLVQGALALVLILAIGLFWPQIRPHLSRLWALVQQMLR
ncbi:MAG TPA: B-box zinc finger protein [Candidatus Nitrosotenuis sp.]|nr:B-box zinc finger protein [Candidatus Nitrosotenuis sp.]